MNATLTTAGGIHIDELVEGTGVSNFFDFLIFGRTNAVPTTTDTVSSLTTDTIPLLAARVALDPDYPKLGDDDPRNAAADPTYWTWRFTREAGQPFVASNVAVTNFGADALDGGAALLVHGQEAEGELFQRADERLTIFVNAKKNMDALIAVSREASLESRVTRVESFTAKTRATRSWPHGSVVNNSEVKTRPNAGSAVWTAAHLPGVNGQVLQPGDVEAFSVTLLRFKPSSGQWEKGRVADIDCSTHIFGAAQNGDMRWTSSGGYNAAYLWFPEPGETEGTMRLDFKLELCDGDIRTWRNVVEVSP